MSFKKKINLTLVAILLLLAFSAAAATFYSFTLERTASQHESISLGQDVFISGEKAALRVLVRNSRDATPLPDSEVRVSLVQPEGSQPIELFQGRTDASGSIEAAFTLPDNIQPGQKLRFATSSALGSDWAERPITLVRPLRLLLTTDKPVYQPGQVIHLRALALDDFNQQAASGKTLEFSAADGKGNKVFRKQVTTSEFGVAAADFQLASEVNLGDYKLSVTLDDFSSEKTVEVKRYVLPKFAITLQPERSFYLVGQHARITLNSAYFYGKPVSQGQVQVSGYTFDFDRQDVFRQQGQTDSSGSFTFEFDLPAFMAGSELENGLGRFYIEASVTDQAAHQETTNLSLVVTEQPLIIEAMPESGLLRPGLDNILYVLVSYPDGSPTQADLKVHTNNLQWEGSTDTSGLAVVHLTPDENTNILKISAGTANGDRAEVEITPEKSRGEAQVLLRPEKPVYQVGEVMRLSLLASQPSTTVFLDIVRGKQTLSTRAVETTGGLAEQVVDLTPDLAGTLELHAYVILPNGNYVRDTRLVVVDNADELQVALQPACDRERQVDGLCVFRPGETVGLDIQVQDAQGSGVRSALGLAIVDESVFAVDGQDPGFERLYFLLEQGLLQPKYDIHGYSVPELVYGLPPEAAEQSQSIQGAAFASLAAALPVGEGFSLEVNSHQEVLQRLRQQKGEQFGRLLNLFSSVCLYIALAVLVMAILILRARRRILLSLGFMILIAGSIAAVVIFSFSEVMALLSLICLGGLLVIGLILLIVRAVQQRDALLGWVLGLLPLYALFFFLAAVSAFQGRNADEMYAWFALISLAIMLCVYPALILGAGVLKPNLRQVAELTLLLLGAFLLANCAMAGAPNLMMEVVKTVEVEKSSADTSQSTGQGDAPRLRQYFPETLLWLPELLTDPDGRLRLDFTAADSITTWRMTALASTTSGEIGSTIVPLRVFQDFFIDLDLPSALTVGDEVSVPIGVYNYLEQAQTVRIELRQVSWFELLDDPVKEISIAGNEIQVVYFRVRALQFGLQPFEVTAWGSQMSDAMLKRVQVYPDGQLMTFSQSEYLLSDQPIELPISYPPGTITGTQTVLVKIYPGVLSQVVEGLESMLRMPYGCFEQTSSTTYPNVLVLDYLKSSGQISPEVQFTAEGYINQGYQRLTTFEVEGSGGFSLFGRSPADRMLTAYGLQEFSDMSRVHPVDAAILDRAAGYLFEQQADDGSWENDRGMYHEQRWESLRNTRLPVTAYLTWSLISAGFAERAEVQQGLAYLSAQLSEADQPYIMALVANALVSADIAAGREPSAGVESVLAQLAETAQREKDGAFWSSSLAMYMGGEGLTADIETTALVALAFIRSGRYSDLANAALRYLVRQKDSYGTWYSTQATIMTLKALLESTRGASQSADARVSIMLNGQSAGEVTVNSSKFDVVQTISLADVPLSQANTLELRMQGEGSLMYQVSGSYYIPWELLSERVPPSTTQPAELQVHYDRSQLAVGETVQVEVRFATLDPKATIASAMVEIGLPPGFSLVTEDLEALVAAGQGQPEGSLLPVIERYEQAGRKLLLYASNVSAEYPLTFSFRLRARFPLRAQTTYSSAYDYYNPQLVVEEAPQVLEVK